MKPMTAVRTRRERRPAKPCRRSGNRVVAARITEAAAPSVALARMFQAAHRPSLESDRPRTSRRSPRPTKGRNSAKSRKGTSISRRRSRSPGAGAPQRQPPRPGRRGPRRPRRPRGGWPLRQHESEVAASFTSGRPRCSGPSACRYRAWTWLSSGGFLPRRALPYRRSRRTGRGEDQGDGHADDAGRPVLSRPPRLPPPRSRPGGSRPGRGRPPSRRSPGRWTPAPGRQARWRRSRSAPGHQQGDREADRQEPPEPPIHGPSPLPPFGAAATRSGRAPRTAPATRAVIRPSPMPMSVHPAHSSRHRGPAAAPPSPPMAYWSTKAMAARGTDHPAASPAAARVPGRYWAGGR